MLEHTRLSAGSIQPKRVSQVPFLRQSMQGHHATIIDQEISGDIKRTLQEKKANILPKRLMLHWCFLAALPSWFFRSIERQASSWAHSASISWHGTRHHKDRKDIKRLSGTCSCTSRMSTLSFLFLSSGSLLTTISSEGSLLASSWSWSKMWSKMWSTYHSNQSRRKLGFHDQIPSRGSASGS